MYIAVIELFTTIVCHRSWKSVVKRCLLLTVPFRQKDPEFSAMLNDMRVGTVSDATLARLTSSMVLVMLACDVCSCACSRCSWNWLFDRRCVCYFWHGIRRAHNFICIYSKESSILAGCKHWPGYCFPCFVGAAAKPVSGSAPIEYTSLHSRNVDVDAINASKLSTLPGVSKRFVPSALFKPLHATLCCCSCAFSYCIRM